MFRHILYMGLMNAAEQSSNAVPLQLLIIVPLSNEPHLATAATTIQGNVRHEAWRYLEKPVDTATGVRQVHAIIGIENTKSTGNSSTYRIELCILRIPEDNPQKMVMVEAHHR